MDPSARTVLIVEDEDAIRRLVERLLRRVGYRTVAASGPNEAIALIHEHLAPDLVISDVVMPGGPASRVIDALAARGLHPPVIFMSGYSESVMLKKGIATDPGSFLPKPFTGDALLAAVARLSP